MKERLRWLRKEHLKLSRKKFGEPLGMTDSEIKNIEYGITELKEVKIPLICATYGVNELWLRTGTGSPFAEKSRKAQIAEILGKAAVGNTVKDKMIRAFASLPDEAYKALADWAEAYAAEVNAAQEDEHGETST